MHEKEQAVKADDFYRNVLKVTSILRYNHDMPRDMEMQRADVDVSIKIGEKLYHISEKFRDVDYGDLYIEIYSKYPHTQGWMHTGKPDAVLYFTPSHVYWINHYSLRHFCFDLLFPSIHQHLIDDFFQSDKHIKLYKVIISGKQLPVKMIKADNKDGTEWVTIGVAVSFDILKSFGLNFRGFVL
jgi:hypothetical protein